jgi:DNA-entry nuclease
MSTNGKTYSFDAKTKVTLNDAGDKKTDPATPVVDNNKTNNSQTGDVKYIGNTNTKKFHYPSCSAAAKIADKNLIYFYSISETAGYDSCGICKPK